MLTQTKKEYKTLIVIVRVIDLNDKVVREVTKTIDSPERRKWLSDTIMWATLNKMYIEVINKDDDT